MKSIIALLKSIGFTDGPVDMNSLELSPVTEGDIVIGVISDDEAQCLAVTKKLNEEHKKIHEEMEADSYDTNDVETRHERVKANTKMVKNITWALLHSRFTDIECPHGLGIREGGKVVALPEDAEDGGGIFGRITVIGIGRMH